MLKDETGEALWYQRAEIAQESLYINFFNPETGVMNQGIPPGNPHNERPIYWWHAHVMDVLADGYRRTAAERYRLRLWDMFENVKRFNNNTLLHNYYDDMEWMALALLRAWDLTGNHGYRLGVLELWEDIKTAWNSHMGGGMAWKKDQRDYKNTPANAPASILAARLFRRFHGREDFEWAKRIYEWNKSNLVDPVTGFVWDGMNRLGDGGIDKDWKFTYCQGVFIGAAVELYHCTGEPSYIADARRTALAAGEQLAEPGSGMLREEGDGDCGLFKGIFIRYLLELIRLQPDFTEMAEMLKINAETAWTVGRDPETCLFSRSWQEKPGPVLELSTHLSGVMLVEARAAMQA